MCEQPRERGTDIWGRLAVMLGHSSGSAPASKLGAGAQPPGLGCPAWSHCNLDELLVVSMRSWYCLRVGEVRNRQGLDNRG